MDFFIWLMIIVVLLLILYLGIGAYAAVTMTRVGEHPQYDQDPGSFGLEYETVYFTSRGDKLKLAAWFIPNQVGKRVIILVHGRDASKQNAISGRLPSLADELHQAGFSILMLDLRGHGESEGKRYTWGEHEKRDVLGAVDFLLERGYSPGSIGVLGISLGGAAAIGAAVLEPAIGAVAVDSTFDDLMDLVEPNWKRESGLPQYFLPGVCLMWKILYRFDLHDVKPVMGVARISSRPILILHSKMDEMIPFSHAERLAAAAPQAVLVLFEEGSHAELFRDNPGKYMNAMCAFFQDKWGC